MSKIKVIFFGTPNFVVPVLDKLSSDGRFELLAVVTQPDKAVGRKRALSPLPVKQFALTNKIKVIQPEKLNKSFRDEISVLEPDVYVVAAYGKILGPKTLSLPKHGAINIHPSLLPKYRGPSPIQATILNDGKETGVSIMLMDEEVDHGPVVGKFEIRISKFETFKTLSDKLFKLGAEKLPDVIVNYVNGEVKPEEQDHAAATYTEIIKKEDGLIDWSKSAEEIERVVRAYNPWPGAYARFKIPSSAKALADKKDLRLKILKARVGNEKADLEPGTLFKTTTGELAVACSDNSMLIVNELQPAGKKKMPAQEFARGYLL